MRLLIIISVCFFFTTNAYSQYPYQLFRPGVQYLYEHDLPATDYTSPLLGIRLNGAACQVMYESLQPNIPSGDLSCFTKVPSFIGSEICQSAGQTSLNLGTDEDPQWLLLFPGAQPGTSWLATVQNNDSVYAKVDHLEWTNVLGLMDSVKTIGLYIKNAQGQFLALYEEAPLKISRNYGLTQGVFLHWLGVPASTIDLVGMSTPLVGLQNPDRQRIFQLQSGDQLHLLNIKTTLTETSFYHKHAEKQNTLVSQGWLNGNSIRYYAFLSDQKIYQSGPAANPDTLYFSAITDTLFLPWASLNYLDQQPGALVASPNLSDTWQVVSLGHRYYCDRPAKRLGAPFFLNNTPCVLPWFGALIGDDFYAHYGGPYYEQTTIAGIDSRILIYANLSEEPPCGTPFDAIVSTTSVSSPAPVNIWPNPVHEELNLWYTPAIGYPLKIEIWSAHGQFINTFTAFTENTSIPVQHLPPGVYHLRYSLPNQPPQTIRFIKQ
jgi:hypothetical protein